MPVKKAGLGEYTQKERAFPIILNMVRSGVGFSTCVAETQWPIDRWRSWLALKPERGERLRLAEEEGHKVALEALRDRALELYDRWLGSVEDRLKDGSKPLATGDVNQLRSMIEGRMPDLRERKLKAEEAPKENDFGFESD